MTRKPAGYRRAVEVWLQTAVKQYVGLVNDSLDYGSFWELNKNENKKEDEDLTKRGLDNAK